MTESVRVIQPSEFTAPLGSKTTEVANAQRLVEQHGANLRYCARWQHFLVWDGRRFKRDAGAIAVERLAKATVRTIYTEAGEAKEAGERKDLSRWAQQSETRSQIANMIALTRSEPGIAIEPEQLDADPWLLNCRNGTLNLRTGEMHEHCREDLITKLVDVDYISNADCPTWLALLERILPTEGLRHFFQRAVGYSLTGDTREQVLFMCLGTGANGKTTTMEGCSRLLGDYGRRTDFGTFLAQDQERVRNDLAGLVGARFVSAVEVDQGRRLSEVVVKELTGGDTISARFLYGEFFEFTPQFKLWLAANHKPEVRGADHAIWRRIRLIPFTVTIPVAEQDRTLPEQLQAELPGMLAWAVRGCLEWQAHGLSEPDEVRDATLAYKEEMDILGGFISDRCAVAVGNKESAASLFDAYVVWAQDSGEQPVTKRTFGRLLRDRGFADGKGTGGVRMWVGLCLSGGTEGLL
jgi:putative DNA primase/helicase